MWADNRVCVKVNALLSIVRTGTSIFMLAGRSCLLFVIYVCFQFGLSHAMHDSLLFKFEQTSGE